MVLLDTHAWIWAFEGDERRFGRRSRQLLSRAEVHNDVRISPVSAFEVSALSFAGHLRLIYPTETWIRQALELPGVHVAELTPTIAFDAGSLPRTMLPDPMDRLLVATARQLGATFVTADRRILDYASRTGSVRVHDAST